MDLDDDDEIYNKDKLKAVVTSQLHTPVPTDVPDKANDKVNYIYL